MSETETVSYMKIDPLTNEKPFFVSESGKVYQKAKARKFPTVRLIIYGIFIPLIAFALGVIYIGGIWNPIEKLTDLHYVIVNEDKGCYAPMCAQMNLDAKTNFGNYYYKLNGKGGKFDIISESKEKAIEMIDNHDYWAALYVPENFTINLLMNLNVANNNTLVPVDVDFIIDEARSYTTVTFVKKAFNAMESAFFNTLVAGFEDKGGFNPLFLIEGINYKENNLHAVTGFGQNFSAFISLLLIWIGTIATAIISHFYFPFENHWIEKKDATNAIVKTMALKIFFCIAVMAVITAICTIIPYVCGEFVVNKGYWSLFGFILFFSLCGLGCNNLLIHLIPFVAYYLIVVTFMFLQLLSCGGLLDNEVQYGFFKIGKIFPMTYGVRTIKNIYWETGDKYTTTSFLVVGAWALVTIVASLYMYYLELRVKRRRWVKRNGGNEKN